ncbi:hypothetical protein CSKR_114050 [Clonorchis sinensis]|uniref:Uncharacterized protein n=1 Tax=Clonorchis sinensis TaxID=79923 RepID=A0A8T1M199_CLOSI|nr:hypothetical protein CSKR_114050 [Clonorchis sinensis]
MNTRIIILINLLAVCIDRGSSNTFYAQCKKRCEDNSGDREDEIYRALMSRCLSRCTDEAFTWCKRSCHQNFESQDEKREACNDRCRSAGLKRCREDCRYGGPGCLAVCEVMYGG